MFLVLCFTKNRQLTSWLPQVASVLASKLRTGSRHLYLIFAQAHPYALVLASKNGDDFSNKVIHDPLIKIIENSIDYSGAIILQ